MDNQTVTWFELSWMFFRHIETDIAKIKATMGYVIDDMDRPVQFRLEKRVSSIHAFDRAFREQNRVHS